MKLTDRIKSWFGMYSVGVNKTAGYCRTSEMLYAVHNLGVRKKQIAQAGIYCEEIS